MEFQSGLAGDPNAIADGRLQTGVGEPALDLRPRPEQQDQAHPQTVEQGDIVDDIGEIRVQSGLAAERQHEGLAPVRVDVGRAVAKPANVLPAVRTHADSLKYQGTDRIFPSLRQ